MNDVSDYPACSYQNTLRHGRLQWERSRRKIWFTRTMMRSTAHGTLLFLGFRLRKIELGYWDHTRRQTNTEYNGIAVVIWVGNHEESWVIESGIIWHCECQNLLCVELKVLRVVEEVTVLILSKFLLSNFVLLFTSNSLWQPTIVYSLFKGTPLANNSIRKEFSKSVNVKFGWKMDFPKMRYTSRSFCCRYRLDNNNNNNRNRRKTDRQYGNPNFQHIDHGFRIQPS